MPNLSTLPPEILLSIIPYIPFGSSNYKSLKQVCPRISNILQTHEHTLSLAIRETQYQKPTLSLFPSLHATYADLLTLHDRLQSLEDLHQTWLQVTNHGPDLGWMRERWLSIHKTGTLLLYRLSDLPTFDAQHDLLNLLPASSLACLTFKLYSSIKILRIYGPEPLNASFAKNDWEQRSDIELAFEEMLLVHGPELFATLLQSRDQGKRDWATELLKAEIVSMESRQLSHTQPTLVSTLRRSFARKTHGGHVGKNVTQMWELLSGTAFDDVGPVEMAKLVAGDGVEGGMRRMGL